METRNWLGGIHVYSSITPVQQSDNRGSVTRRVDQIAQAHFFGSPRITPVPAPSQPHGRSGSYAALLYNQVRHIPSNQRSGSYNEWLADIEYLRHYGDETETQQTRDLFHWFDTLSINSPKYASLTISKTQLEKTPGRLLCSLHSLMASDASQLMIKFVNDSGRIDKGSDMGALSREFLAKLLKGVAAEKNGPLAFHDNMPLLKSAIPAAEEKQGYEAMGRLMGMCIDRPEIRTGSNFPPLFFSALKAISALEAQNPNLNSALKVFLALDPGKEMVVNCLKSKNLTADGLREEALSWAFPEGLPKEAQPTDEQIHNEIMNNLQVMRRATPFFSIVHGLQRSCALKRVNWDLIRQRNFIALSQAIQGIAVSKEKIEVQGRVSEQKTFFKQWLKEASQERLELLVYVATGSATLNEGLQTITIEPADVKLQQLGSPQFAACGGVVSVPQYKNYAAFKEAFELALGSFLNGGFTMD